MLKANPTQKRFKYRHGWVRGTSYGGKDKKDDRREIVVSHGDVSTDFVKEVWLYKNNTCIDHVRSIKLFKTI